MVSSISLSIDSDLDKVSLLARAVRALCEDFLSPDDQDAVELSLVEAINNVIKHGYQGKPGKDVQVAVGLQSDQVVIDIIDHASPMEPQLLEQPAADPFSFDETELADIPESGMGLALIRMNMDEVQYLSSETENRLRMVKRIERPLP
ncbi:ATP-binding protein [Microvirga aerilata]|jgi:serine/threonine-protein kinase RsbW|uniref:ATP-binding protein n=1 Tax=Microvirga aerilata TaxID=670292 RepID=A0A937D110_9HYPH|nr:ATP-binding protein [Microvirga aerilata]MBL0406471.1 ATP-binding protein [Microvirga aerilata]